MNIRRFFTLIFSLTLVPVFVTWAMAQEITVA